MRIVILFIQCIASSNPYSFVLQNDYSPHAYLSITHLHFLLLVSSNIVTTMKMHCKYFEKCPISLFPPNSSHAQDQGDISFVALMLGATFLKLGRILKKAREKVTQFLLSSNLWIGDYALTSHSIMHFCMV
jgi:hypothetical protein